MQLVQMRGETQCNLCWWRWTCADGEWNSV